MNPTASTSTPGNTTLFKTNAVRAAGTMVVAMLILAGMVINSGPVDTWQDFTILGVAGGIILVSLLSAALSIMGRGVWGMRLLLLTFMLGMVSVPLLVAEVAWVVALGTFAIVYILSYLTLPADRAREMLMLAGVVGVGMILLDVAPPAPRIASYITTSLVINIVAAVVLGFFGPLAAWQMQNVRLPVKMGLVLVIFVVGFGVFGLAVFSTLRQVEIGSDLYDEVVDGKDLLADILPPPGYLVGARLNSHQLQDALQDGASEAELLALVQQAKLLRTNFVARHIFWQEHLAGYPEREAIRLKMKEAYQLGLAYLDARDVQYIPLLLARNLVEGDKVHSEQLEPLYAAHLVAIDEAVALIQAGNQVIETEVTTTVSNSLSNVVFLGLIAGGLGALIIFLISRSIVNSIGQLSRSAESLARGELETVAETGGVDEVSTLAQTFNTMAAKVKTMLDNLEQDVAHRTREVQIAAQVGKGLVQKGDLISSLKNAVETIARDFDFYAAQVYLFDPATQLLVLRASSGEVGEQLVQRGHHLLLGQNSLNSKAATERRMAMATDTSKDLNFKANPLRPHIRSEIALPLLDGARLLGVLDLQSDKVGRFTQADVMALQLLADELTFAIRNSELLYEALEARRSLEEQARWLTREGWQEFLNAIQRRERIQATYQASDATPLSGETRTVTMPIQIAGQAVGEFALEMPITGEDEVEIKELMQATAQAVAQQVDNLRLLAQGEQYRAEAEEAVRRLTREGWQTYVRDAAQLAEGFGYDGVQVQPATAILLGEAVEQQPLTVRGEQVGEIVIEAEALTPEAEQILAAVSEQLTAHIENLRLSEQTYAALAENERRNATLAALNRVVSAASSARDVSDLLNTAAQEILQALQARNVGVAVFTDGSRSQLRVMADANSSPNDSSAIGVLIPVVGNTSTEYVLTNRHSLVVEKAQTDPRTASIHELMRARSTHSLMIVPLLSRGEIIGTIGVDSDDPNRHFSSEEVSLVETMAGQLAGAIDNLRSFEQTQRRANREAIINDITAKIQGTVTVDSALQTTIQELGKALKARKTRVALGVTSTEPETNGHTTPN